MLALDGIRAIAVVAVIAFHAGLRGASGGYLGVSLFFTLSGFLMGMLVLREREHTGRVDVLRFWERRLRRLLPAAIATLAGIAVLSAHDGFRAGRNGLRAELLSALAYVANWRLLREGRSYASLFESPSPVQHFWSLSIEEQFYVFFPLLILGLYFLGRHRRRIVVIALATLCAASVAAQFFVSSYDRAYYGTDTRACELLAGALLACAVLGREGRIVRRRRTVTRVGVLALVAFVGLVALTPAHAPWLVHGGFGAIAVLNVALIRAALVPESVFVRALSLAPVVAIGRVSYGLYLYHWPVFLWLDETRTGMSGAALLVVRVAVTGVLAVLSYHLLECPIRHRRFLVRRRQFVGVIGASLAFVVVLAATAPQPEPASTLFDERSFTPTPDPLANAVTAVHAREAPLRVMVIGDSTGHVLAQGLAARPDMDVLDATRTGCPLLHTPTARRFAGDAPRDVAFCDAEAAQLPIQAKAFDPDLALVVGSFEDAGVLLGEQPAWSEARDVVAWYRPLEEQYQSLTTSLLATGAVVAWTDLPYFTFIDHPEVRDEQRLDARVRMLNTAVADTTTRTLGAVTVDFASHLNAPDGSIDLAARPDGVHLSTAAVHTAVNTWFGPGVREAYAAARGELGITDDSHAQNDRPAPLRVLVVGDSTSLNLATGLANHGRAHGDLTVDWAGQVACPIVDAVHFRMITPDPQSTEGCHPATSFWTERATQFHPDVVVVFSLFMDAMDLDLREGGWGHLGQSRFDAAYAAQIDRVVESLAPSGAVVLWSDAPRPALPAGGLDRRFRALNDLIARADARWRQVVTLPLAAHVDGAGADLGRAARPDGLHFTMDAATSLADGWLVDEIVARTQQATAEASPCRTTTGAGATIALDACHASP